MNFRDYFKNRFDFESELAKFVKDEIYEHAKKFIENQNALGKKFYNDFKKYEKDWLNAIMNCEKVNLIFLSE